MTEKEALTTKNGTLYRHVEGNTFKNIISGVSGEVTDEKAREVFRINLDATSILNDNPNVERLIEVLKLKIEI